MNHRQLRHTFPRTALVILVVSMVAVVAAGCGGSSSRSATAQSVAAAAQAGTPQAQQTLGQIQGSRNTAKGASPHSPSRSSGSQSQSAPQAAATPAQSNADIGQAASQKTSTPTRSDRIITGKHPVQRARYPKGTVNDDQNNAAPALNPCKLVSLAEARAIVRSEIAAQTEAPLGPTCIYRAASAKRTVTMAIEAMPLPQAVRSMRGRTAVSVRGHNAYCGKLGAPMLFARVGDSQVLNVTAPCEVAMRFAALALARLTA
jgi:hypothetical protein